MPVEAPVPRDAASVPGSVQSSGLRSGVPVEASGDAASVPGSVQSSGLRSGVPVAAPGDAASTPVPPQPSDLRSGVPVETPAPEDTAPVPAQPPGPPSAPPVDAPAPPAPTTPLARKTLDEPRPHLKPYIGSGPPTYDADPTALPLADPDALDDLVPDTVLDGARYGAATLRAVSLRGDSARYRGEPRRDALLTARFGYGENALVLVAMATGARATAGAHRAAAEVCRWIGRAVGRSHVRLVEDIRAGRRGDLKSGLHRLTDRSLGRLRAGAAEQGLTPEEYTATLRCLLLPADPACRTRVFFGVGEGGLFRLRGDEWQDIEPAPGEPAGEPDVTARPRGNPRIPHTRDATIPDTPPLPAPDGTAPAGPYEANAAGPYAPGPHAGNPPGPYEANPADPYAPGARTLNPSGPYTPGPRALNQPGPDAGARMPNNPPRPTGPYTAPHDDHPTPDLGSPADPRHPSALHLPTPYDHLPPPDPFLFRTSVAQPGDTLLMCTAGLADPLRGELELAGHLTARWAGAPVPGLAEFLADIQIRVKGYADDRTAAAVWEA
ncbi:protein phosphatase 2C domain-containing protein [Streptomyces niveiscabiei]|uniref:Protein phosphatase 2C domain-containing protein n=1 Tax=Streptomyces niveiscabiei TaxID=164115 RepID=A0ABW9I6J9_9ACTN